MIMKVLMIFAIACMLVLIGFLLMVIGFIPSEKICNFLRKHKKVQVVLGIVMAIGLISSGIAIA